MTEHETLGKVGQELEALALSHGVCIAAAVTAGEGEGLTLVANPLASSPLTLLRATIALEVHAARFVEENAPEAYQSLAREKETAAQRTPLTRTGWMKIE
jgi:hypothetical protein